MFKRKPFCISILHVYYVLTSKYHKKNFAFKIDLKDTYFHEAFNPDSKKYVCLIFMNKVNQFGVLLFSLPTGYQVFTHLGHHVASYLHIQRISILPYFEIGCRFITLTRTYFSSNSSFCCIYLNWLVPTKLREI